MEATTKKGRQLCKEKQCTPRQNPGYAYDAACVCVITDSR